MNQKQKKIKEIQLKNFRVYKNITCKINPNVNVVLIYGNNGLGKTSMFDAIEWGITGRIRRYEGAAREKNEYPILENVFKEVGESSYSKIIFDDDSIIKRNINKRGSGDYNNGILENSIDINQELIKEAFHGIVDLKENFNFSQFLSQELINTFIRGNKDVERYNSVVNLFGLSKYKEYEEFSKKVVSESKKTEQEINLEKERIIGEINKRKVNFDNLSLDIKTICSELNLLLQNKEEIDWKLSEQEILKSLNKIFEKYITCLEEENKKIEENKIISSHLTFMHKNSKEYKDNLLELSQLNNLIINYKKYKEHLVAIERIKVIEDNYILYKENELYKQQLDQMEIRKREILEHINTINKNNSLEEKLKNLVDLGYIKSDIYNEYFEIKKTVDGDNKEIERLDIILSERALIRTQFYKISKEYLNENKYIEQCPLCNNYFDVNKILNALNDEIDNKVNEEDKRIIESIEKLKVRANDNKCRINELVTFIINQKNQAEIHLNDKIIKINNDINIYNNILYKINTVKEYMKQLDIVDMNELDVKKEKHLRFIEINNVNFDLNYYEQECSRMEARIDEIKEKNKIYDAYRIKYKIEQDREIEQAIIDNISKIEDSEKFENRINKILNLSDKLIKYYTAYLDANELNIFQSQLDKLEEILKKVETVRNSFESIQINTRKVVGVKTEEILLTYRELIAKIYNYLNPNLNFNEFKFKIDNSNPANNRMILEVIG